RRYWSSALIPAPLGGALAAAVVGRHHKDGPQGPLWFDVLAVVAFTTPLFARRRFPIGAPLAVAVATGSSTFVDGRLVPDDFITFLIGIALVVIFGMRPARWQSVAGLAFVLSVGVIVVLND